MAICWVLTGPVMGIVMVLQPKTARYKILTVSEMWAHRLAVRPLLLRSCQRVKSAARRDATRDVLFLHADVSHTCCESCRVVHAAFEHTNFMSYAGLLEPTYQHSVSLRIEMQLIKNIRN